MVESLIFAVLKTSAIVSAVTLLLMVLRPFILKKRTAKWLYFLFLVLFVRLILPFDFTLPEGGLVITVPDVIVSATEELPVQNEVPKHPVAETPSVSEPTVNEPIYSEPSENVQSDRVETVDNSNNSTADSTQNTPPISVPSEPEEPIISDAEEKVEPSFEISLFDILGAVYVAGLAVFVLCQAVCYFIMQGTLKRNSVPCENPLVLETAEEVRKELCLKRKIPVKVCSAVSTPTLAGLIKPVLLFPENCDDPNYLSYIFRHEYMHYKYGDLYFKLLALAANAVHWFNPVIYLLRRESEKVVEFVCDSRVVEKCDGKFRFEYCNAIVDEVERSVLGKKKSSYMTTSFTGNKKTLKERLESILDTGKKRKGTISFVAIVLLIAIAGTIVSCNVGASDKNDDIIDYKTPIPDNVVIDPDFEYSAVDPENYDPHISTGDGELIDKLYSYVYKPYREAYAELVYRAEKVTVENIDSYLMLMTVFNTFGTEGLETRTFYSEYDSSLSVEYYIYPQKLMDERIKIIFGEDAKVEHGSFYPMDYASAEYFADEHFYRFEDPWAKNNSDNYNHYEYLRYEQKGKYIYIYDTYYCTYGGTLACSLDTETKISLENGVLPEYKHTFKKGKNGNYHWVSTELVTDLESIIVPETDDRTEDEKLVDELYDYILKSGHSVVYRNGTTTVDDLSDGYMLEVIHDIYGTKGLSRVMESSKIKEHDWLVPYFSDYGWEDNVLFVVPEELMEERIRAVFGEDAEIEHQSYVPYNSNAFGTYSAEDKCYYLGYDGGLGGDLGNPSNTYYLGYENKGDEFIIYDKFAFTPANYMTPYPVYRDCEQKEVVTAFDINDFGNNLRDHATVYKHTFKKSSDGSYYWYSTEQATAENGISEEIGETYVVSDTDKANSLAEKLWNDFSLESIAGSDYEPYTSVKYVDPSAPYNQVKGSDLMVVALKKYGSESAYGFWFDEENGEYSLRRSEAILANIPEYYYSIVDYEAYKNGDNSKFDALAYLCGQYLLGYEYYSDYDNSDYAMSTMVDFCVNFFGYGLTYVDFQQFNSLWDTDSSLYYSLREQYGMKYDSGYLYFPMGAMFGDLDSEYIGAEILSISHRETNRYGTHFADVILKMRTGEMKYAEFVFNEENFYMSRIEPYYNGFDFETVDNGYAEELYNIFDIDYVLLKNQLPADHEFHSIVKGESDGREYIDIYYRFYEHFYYTTPFAVIRFNIVNDGCYIDYARGLFEGPDGETTPLVKSDENATEPIPENVVIKPEVTYTAFDSGNYTPHLDTGNGELINELYSYILKPFRSEFMELVYQDEKLTVDTLDDYIMQMTVFAVFGVEGLEIRTETSSFGDEREYLIYPASLMEERAKIIYGDDVTIDHFTFYPMDYHTAEYVPDGEYYRLPSEPFPWESQNWGDQMNFSEFIRYEEDGEYIYIYDRFYTTEKNGSDYYGNIYACSAGEHLIAEKLKQGNYRYKDPETGEIVVAKGFGGAVIPEYKHTFMKDENGVYHWVSTEPVTDISSIEIEPGSEFTDPDDILAEKLYGYLMKYDYYNKELVYQSGTTTQADISDYLKRYTVSEVFGLGGLDREMSGALLQDSYKARVNLIYPAELMEERVRQIFGPDATVEHSSGSFHDGESVVYSEEDRCYYFSAYDGGGDSPNCNYIYYIRHENRGDEFVIYDKYVYMTEVNGIYKYYRATAQQDFITQTDSKTPEQYATVYKHTFKKAADGSYYWYSTEQATADNGISEEVGEVYVVSDSGTIESLGRKLFEDYASGNSLAGAEYYASVELKETFVDSADLVIFYLEKNDDFAALYFKENNGEYQFLRADNDVTYTKIEPDDFSGEVNLLSGMDMFPNYNYNLGDGISQYKYAVGRTVYFVGVVESEGIIYVNSEDFYGSGGYLPKKTTKYIWDYSSGYLIMPKAEPLESSFNNLKVISFEKQTETYWHLIYETAVGEKYYCNISALSPSLHMIRRYYDDFEYMSEDLSDPQKNLLFVKELFERFGDDIRYRLLGLTESGYAFKAITKGELLNGDDCYFLHFEANVKGEFMYDFFEIYIRIYNGGLYYYGGSWEAAFGADDAYVYSKDEVDAVLGDILSEENVPEIIEPTPVEPEAPVPVEPVAPVSVEPAPPADVPAAPEVVSQSDETLAAKLYEYIIKHDEYSQHELVYREGITYASDLSEHLKSYTVYTVYGLFGKELPRVGMYEEDSKLTAQGYSWAYEGGEYESNYRRIFGPDAEVNHADFRWGYSLYGVYFPEDRCYYITRQGGGDDWKVNYTYYIGCKNNGDEFIIYDKYVYVDSIIAPYNLYKASNGKGFITQINDKNFEQYATVYKHTFKKISGNSYYWYSTEQATAENGISDEASQYIS